MANGIRVAAEAVILRMFGPSAKTAETPGRIYKMTLDGEILGWLGESGRGPGQFNWIHGISCRDENVLYVADMNNWRVQKLLLNQTARTSNEQ